MEALRAVSRTTLAVATAVLIFVALLFGYVLDVTNNEEGEGDLLGWLIVSVVASVLAAVLLLRFVPATESDGDPTNKPARRGLVLSVLSVITLAVFGRGCRSSWASQDSCSRPRDGHALRSKVAAEKLLLPPSLRS
jgi:hypothetical protein